MKVKELIFIDLSYVNNHIMNAIGFDVKYIISLDSIGGYELRQDYLKKQKGYGSTDFFLGKGSLQEMIIKANEHHSGKVEAYLLMEEQKLKHLKEKYLEQEKITLKTRALEIIRQSKGVLLDDYHCFESQEGLNFIFSYDGKIVNEELVTWDELRK